MSTGRSNETRTVSLVLGSGGARGLAHIGAIRALEESGFTIESIAGSSMGAVVGAMHAAGKLEDYAQWVVQLKQSDFFRLVDWTLSSAGLIRGDKIIKRLKDLVGDVHIEALPIDFTAVAVDIEQGREIWLSEGSLFDAIRGSIAIPGLFTPHRYHGRLLVDGGILNPVPVAATLRSLTDLTVVINVNGPIQMKSHRQEPGTPGRENGDKPEEAGFTIRIRNFYNDLIDRDSPKLEDSQPGLAAMLIKSLETMQAVITRQHLAVFQPDLVVEIPKDACMIHEFHRAEELIDLGYRRTIEALDGPRGYSDE